MKSALRRRGFTLVELLVVIGIIALLISILLPVLNKAREQAKNILCQNNEKQIMMAVHMYASNYHDATIIPPAIGMEYPPSGSDKFQASLAYYMDSLDSGASQIRFDQGAFWPFLSNGYGPWRAKFAVQGSSAVGVTPFAPIYRLFNCPSDTDYRADRWGSFGFARSVDRNFTYSWNRALYPADGEKWRQGDQIVARLGAIIEPSNKILLEEENSPNDGWSFAGYPGDDADDTPGHRHTGRANYGFADGHVESLSPSDLGYTSPDQNNPQSVVSIVNYKTTAHYFHLVSNAP